MPTAGTDEPLRFEHFELHPAERLLRVRGEPVPVGSRAFDVLLALAQRRERLVTKQELLDLVWPGLVVEEHNIATQIGTLRKKLGAGAIATLPGYGYRLTAASLSPSTASAPSQAVRPCRNLPEPRTRFIGREAALADLARLMPSTRLLTLTGIGGCGKTRLAMRFAQQRADDFADGIRFIDLAPLQDSGRVAPACASVLGIVEEADAPILRRIAEHVAARRMLLVLDNCEHVRDGVVALSEALLASPGPVAVLATSREALGVDGEQLYPVRSLSLPMADDEGSVLGAESARVFVDRARLLVPDFEIDATNAAALAEICRRLDGIALAIELAAARVSMLSLDEIARRLDDRFRLLTGGRRGEPRHQTLHAAMQWSYEQLTADEQRMLRQMSVFAGGWTLQAAAQVAPTTDEYEALALLTVLHDKSMLVVGRDDAGKQPRYRMLETVRQFALERAAECGEAGAARDRHVAHFIAVAEEAESQVRGPEQDLWMGRFRQEHDNLVTALRWCVEGALDPRAGLRLAAATGYYWCWNHVELGYGLTRDAIERNTLAVSTRELSGALRLMARLGQFRARYEESLSYALRALKVARDIDDLDALAWAQHGVGSSLASLGRHEPALQAEQEALLVARRLNDHVLMFTILNNIASLQHQAGQLDLAESCYREALACAHDSSGRVGVVILLDNLIRLLVARGKLDEARRFAAACLPLARDEKVSLDLVDVAVGLASSLGDHATAARFWGATERQRDVWGYRHEPIELEHVEPLLANSRLALGDEAFEVHVAAGRRIDYVQILLELELWLGVRTGSSPDPSNCQAA